MNTDKAVNEFWEFSTALYAIDEVRDYCLALQERQGIDVNLLLFCGWVGSLGQILTGEKIEWLIAVVEPVREQEILKLRQRRRKVSGKTAEEQLRRQSLLQQELEAEKKEQQLLYDWWRRQSLATADCRNAVATNLEVYFRRLGFTGPDQSRPGQNPLVEKCCSPLWFGG